MSALPTQFKTYKQMTKQEREAIVDNALHQFRTGLIDHRTGLGRMCARVETDAFKAWRKRHGVSVL